MEENNLEISSAEAKRKGNKEAVIEALKETPVIQFACKRAGIGRTTFYRYCHDDPVFAKAISKAITEGSSIVSDLAELQLIAAIRDRDMSAIKYWLSHHNQDYATKLKVTTELSDDNKLTPEQKVLIEEALRLAGLTEQDALDANNDEQPME